MHKNLIKRYIGIPRFSKFGDFDSYGKNLKKGKESYILLAILEVSLRNAINEVFEYKFGEDWLIREADFLHTSQIAQIRKAKAQITARNETLHKDKLLAELNLGFWTSLFKSPYSNIMRFGTLKNIFPSLPNKQTMLLNRKIISAKLNHIREFRNRVFHYENILKPEFADIFGRIDEILCFFDKDLSLYAKEINSILEV